jgi:hypothetical protein
MPLSTHGKTLHARIFLSFFYDGAPDGLHRKGIACTQPKDAPKWLIQTLLDII